MTTPTTRWSTCWAPAYNIRDPLRGVLGVPTDGSAAHIRTLLDECDPARTAVASFTVHTPTLDDVFQP
jgi:ABC-2 type transport system ATP-binding protein